MDKVPSTSFSFSFHDIDEERLGLSQAHLIGWLERLSRHYQKPVDQLDYIFCTDAYVHQLNSQFLDHDYLTDILTFPYEYSPIKGEVFISLDRAEDNARSLEVNIEDELLRLIAHGFLHMSGWNDSTDSEKEAMRREEDFCIQLFSQDE